MSEFEMGPWSVFTEKYKSESNSVLRFINDIIQVDTNLNKYISISTCWDKYKDWVREQNDDAIKSVSKAEFDKSFPEQMIVPYNTVKCNFKNIKFKDFNAVEDESDDLEGGNKNKKSLDL